MNLILTFLAGLGIVNVIAMFVGDAPLWLWLVMIVAGMLNVMFVEVVKKTLGYTNG